jgi:hypothetical protein
MQAGGSQHLNLRLDGAQFISTDADRVYFAKLVAEVSSWERPGEKLSIAPIEEPFAWRRNYQLLQALEKRGHDRPAVETAHAIAMSAHARVRLQNEFAADRAALLEFKHANRQQWSTLAAYVGLDDADLVPGERDERFNEELGWREKHERIGGCLQRLQGMTPTEKADARRVVEERRRVSVLAAHDHDIDNLRTAVAALQQAVMALQSNQPSQAEIRAAADA